MRIQIAKILLVLMTLSGIIMPIHAYAHGLADTQESHSMEINTQHDADSDSISCDHCCHLSSHSLVFDANEHFFQLSTSQKCLILLWT